MMGSASSVNRRAVMMYPMTPDGPTRGTDPEYVVPRMIRQYIAPMKNKKALKALRRLPILIVGCEWETIQQR